MSRPPLTSHGRASVLILGRRVAAELAAAALDPLSGLPHRVRVALADLVVAVDVAACRRAGIQPPSDDLRARLRAALTDPGAARAPP